MENPPPPPRRDPDFYASWRRFTVDNATRHLPRDLRCAREHTFIVCSGRIFCVCSGNTVTPVTRWLIVGVDDPDEDAVRESERDFRRTNVTDTILTFAERAMRDFLTMTSEDPSVNRLVQGLRSEMTTHLSAHRSRFTDFLCRLVVFVFPRHVGGTFTRNEFLAPKTVQSRVRAELRDPTESGRLVAPRVAAEERPPAAAEQRDIEVHLVDSDSGSESGGDDEQREREMLRRLRSMNQHGTFLPPREHDDFVKPDAVDRRCQMCWDDVPVGAIALRMPPPCRLKCVCRECIARLAADSTDALQCTFCTDGASIRPHPIPAAILASVLPERDFVSLRKKLAMLRNGRMEGWEATATCMNPACARPGLPLFMNSPSFSCNFCDAAPRYGWCAFCGVDYDPGHVCRRTPPSVTVAEVLHLIEVERMPVVHPCPNCMHLTVKEYEEQCNHITCSTCKGVGFCGVCGEEWLRNGHNTVSCHVSRAFVRGSSEQYAGGMNVLENEYAKASIVAAYARVSGEEVPERLRPVLDVIRRTREERGVTWPLGSF